MPRGFSENQMLLFKNKLIAAAFEALKNTGVRKTTVEELVKTAGLSTGAFYKFFPTKETLFFEVYEIAEESLKAEFASSLESAADTSPLTLRLTLKQLLRSEAMQAYLRLMQKDELDYMLRSIETALVEHHMQKDYEFLQNVTDLLRAKGLNFKIDVSLLLSYLQALFVLCYEKEQYPQHAEQIIDAFVDTIVTEAVA